MVTKFTNSNYDKTKKLKFWHNSNCDKAQIMTKPELWQNSNFDKTWIVTNLKWWQNWKCEEKTQIVINSTTEIVMKLKNSNCDKTLKLKLWQNSKTHSDKTQKLKLLKKNSKNLCETKPKLWQNLRTQTMTKKYSKNQIVTKLKNSNCDESQIVIKIKKTQLVTKLTNLPGDQTHKLKLWQNSKLKFWH